MNHSKCSSCGSNRCIQIVYGRLVETPQLKEALRTSKVVLGGCLYSKDQPEWRCLDCGQEWHTDQDKDQKSP